MKSIVDINNRQSLGFLAENVAARYLEGQGYKVTEKNYRKPWGEIDIIAAKDDVMVFVEVKSNRQEFAGNFDPELRVDWRKVNKIKRTAALYMQYEAGNSQKEWQIDVVSVVFDVPNGKAKIKHFRNI